MIKKICILFLVLALPVICFGSIKQQILLGQASVVTVINYDKNGREAAKGTGFYINGKAHIVTNLHVVKDAESVGIKTKDGKTFKLSKVVNSDEDYDLFIFTVAGINSTGKYLSLQPAKHDVGDSVMVIGNPMGLEQTVSTGIISGIREDDKEYKEDFVYQITAPISPGSSGSPVMNEKGGVIGVATMQYKKGQNLNFVMPSDKLMPMIKKNAGMDFKAWKEKGYCFEPVTYRAAINFAYRLIDKDEYQNALKKALSLIKKYPKKSEAYRLAANALYELEKETDAEKYMKAAVKLNPKKEYMHNALGVLYKKMEYYDLAAKEFYEEIKVAPQNDAAYYNLASVYLINNMQEDALKILDKGIKIAKNPSDLYLKNASILSDGGNRDLAIEKIKKAVEFDPYNADAQYILGVLALENGDKAGAYEIKRILEEMESPLAKKLGEKINQ
ncbi:MAG: trypsin-like peptidase domain-containing protein [Candidatus Goldbacteria bacterium]|nr:trypsin-like peptidase domain-containing protein [Candidatus Goldiibacteriota bacterium]